ncbi:hypothetical protein SAMN06265348_102299 [Pedobacter westerhofensis]|uniref:Uncharacterized protein n=1 Tax=Pedobacter westerhofensis TaxID=425512 RepID=A0A521BHD4_9SPHI|nr:hypothetical protein SAMN06265348_102299 [Pedobacter westerhofensis]
MMISAKYFCLLIGLCFFLSCDHKDGDEAIVSNIPAATLVLQAADSTINQWLKNDIEGIEFLNSSVWKIDEYVVLNSTHNRGCLLLLNQDKDPRAELDYVQVLYAAKEDGRWKIYLASMPNLVIQRISKDGKFSVTSLEKLSRVGRKELDSRYKNVLGQVNDNFINQEYNSDLKNNQKRFTAEKVKHRNI